MARSRRRRGKKGGSPPNSPSDDSSLTDPPTAGVPLKRGPSFQACVLGWERSSQALCPQPPAAPSSSASVVLPAGLLLHAFSFLTAKDLMTLAPASRTFNDTSNSDALWEPHFQADFDPTLTRPQLHLIKSQYIIRLRQHHDRRKQQDLERTRQRAQLARGRARDLRNLHKILNLIPENLWINMLPSDLNNLLGALYAGCMFLVGIAVYLMRAVLYKLFAFILACIGWWLPLAGGLLLFLLPVLGVFGQIMQDDVRSFLPFELLRFYRQPWMWTAGFAVITILREVLFSPSVPFCAVVFLLRAIPFRALGVGFLAAVLGYRLRQGRRPLFTQPVFTVMAIVAGIFLLYFIPGLEWRPSLLIAALWLARAAGVVAISLSFVTAVVSVWCFGLDAIQLRSLRAAYRSNNAPMGLIALGPAAAALLFALECVAFTWEPPLWTYPAPLIGFGLLHVLRAVGAVLGFFWYPFATINLVGFLVNAPWSHDVDLGMFVMLVSVILTTILVGVHLQVEDRNLQWITVWKHFALSYVEPPPPPPACNLFTEAVFDTCCPWGAPPQTAAQLLAAATCAATPPPAPPLLTT